MDRWMKAEGARTYKEMREVFLMEHFMDQLPPILKYELISYEVRDVMETGRKADNYCDAHELSKGEYKGAKKPFSYKNDNGYKYNNSYQVNSRPYNHIVKLVLTTIIPPNATINLYSIITT